MGGRDQRARGAASGPNDKDDPVARRSFLGEFRRRYRFFRYFCGISARSGRAENPTFFNPGVKNPSELHAERMLARFPPEEMIVEMRQDQPTGCVWYPDWYQTEALRGKFAPRWNFKRRNRDLTTSSREANPRLYRRWETIL